VEVEKRGIREEAQKKDGETKIRAET